jgi:hypothetical protein
MELEKNKFLSFEYQDKKFILLAPKMIITANSAISRMLAMMVTKNFFFKCVLKTGFVRFDS